MEITVTTAKYALVLMSVGGAAAGLNLGVMELSETPSTESAEQVLLSSGSEPVSQDPVQVVVDVPVVVPDSMVTSTLPEATALPPAAPAKASFSVAVPDPAPPAPAQATVKAASTTSAPAAPAPATAATSASAPAKRAATPVASAAPQTSQPPATSAAPHTTQTPATTAAATVPAMAATEYKYYDFPGVASQIIVAKHGDGSLEFWSVTAEPGWSYRVEKDTSRIVEVEFSQEPDGEGEAKWILRYNDGELSVKKERSFDEDEDEDEEEEDEH